MNLNEIDIRLDPCEEEVQPFDLLEPEKGLMAAVLLSALADLDRPGEPNRKATTFFLDVEDEYIYSFRGICSYLSLDPSKVLQITGIKKS